MLTAAPMNSISEDAKRGVSNSPSERAVRLFAPLFRSPRFFAMSLLAGCLLIGCGSDPKPVPTVAEEPAPATTASAKVDDGAGAENAGDRDSDKEISKVGIDDRIRKMCDLPEARFDFDSASVSSSAAGVLDKVAKCFISGAAREHSMRIVGHTDERGETEYNFALGQRRAGAVAGYLLRAGLAEERVATSSQGELEASGTDAAGWSKDRRVELLLAD